MLILRGERRAQDAPVRCVTAQLEAHLQEITQIAVKQEDQPYTATKTYARLHIASLCNKLHIASQLDTQLSVH